MEPENLGLSISRCGSVHGNVINSLEQILMMNAEADNIG